MIINHNISSLNTYNKLATNNNNTSKSLEKLSSGLRINKAGDDAAGLAISEKMRGQIRGLDQATANSQDGISLLQTAEGGLSETHSILQRMRELAVQSATDTNTDSDRTKIQGEVDQLAKEITRISNTTEFNTQNLLAGGLNNTLQIGANAGQNLKTSVSAMDAQSLGVAAAMKSAGNLTSGSGITSIVSSGRGMAAGDGYQVKITKTEASVGAVTINTTAASGTQAFNSSSSPLTIGAASSFTGTADTTYMVKIASVDGTTVGNNATSISYSKDNGVSFTTVSLNPAAASNSATIDGMKFSFTEDAAKLMTVGDTVSFKATAAKGSLQLMDSDSNLIGNSTAVNAQSSLVVVGDTTTGQTVSVNFNLATASTATATATATFNIDETASIAATTSNGVVSTEASTLAGIDVSSQKAADSAITAIDKAINTVSAERSKIGAYQNRLEHTIANLGTSSENMTAAESRIRDVDMAKEMMSFQKNQILAQAATSMLAQANQAPNNVLKLLG